ncbi:MAG: cephalosporin hydroxylase [Planctomycetaceae bacterium]|nr:MAG: cephalosporin hydroxylase [Planctomycetaceae bacterium]
MMTRREFEDCRKQKAGEMAADGELHTGVIDVLSHSDRYDWYQQMTWMGEPVLSFPQDLFAVQELVYRLRPTFIIELGVAWGGSLLFYASLMDLFGGAGVVGIDVNIPDDLAERLNGKGKVLLYQGSSTAPSTVRQMARLLNGGTRNLVILDSAHNHDHVLAELEAYAPFVGPGYYLVCGDTVIEEMPPQHRPRSWGPGNSPKTAVDAFLAAHPEFVADHDFDRLLITCNPGGYLRHVDL